MAITVKHKFVSAIPDAGDPTIVQPSNWNDDHTLVGNIVETITSTDGSVTVTGTSNVDLSVAVAASTTNVIVQVRNNTGATLTKGTVVYMNGAVGQIPTVTKALATSDATSAQSLGMMSADLANNSNGYVTVIGLLSNMDTSAYTDGQQLYLSSTTAGAVTATKQYAPAHLVYVAFVEHAHPTQGKLFVKVQNGYEMDELHNVSAQTPSNGNTLVYNTSTSLWEQSNSPIIGGGTINGTVIGGTTPAAGTFTTITGQTEVLKGTGQNLILFSEQFDNANWAKTNVTVSPNVTTAPDGTSTADSLVETIANSSHYVDSSLVAIISGAQYVFSVYAKKGDGATAPDVFQITYTAGFASTAYANFAISGASAGTVTATGVTASISSVGNGWYRCSMVATANSSTNGEMVVALINNNPTAGRVASYAGLTTSNIFIWGGQLEIASSVGAYVQTTTTAIYGTPTLSFSGVAGLGLQSDGSLYVSPAGTGALQAQATTSTATGGNARGANAVDWQTSRGSATQVASSTYTVVAGGTTNTSNGFAGAVVGGNSNQSSGSYTFTGAGRYNISSGSYSAVAGGENNLATGYHNFMGGGFKNSGTANAAVTTQSGTMNATTAVTLSGSNASIKVGQYITGTSIQSDPPTYVAAISGTALTLSQAASGSSTSTLSFYTPHGVVVGGGNNQATGAYSFIGGGGDAGTAANRNVASGDWSFVGGGRNNTASGLASFVGGGGTTGDANNNGNTASGSGAVVVGGTGGQATGTFSSVLGGQSNRATGGYDSVLLGQYGTTRAIQGNGVFSSNLANPFGFVIGSSQSALLMIGAVTTDATATALRSSGGAAGTTNQVILPNNSAYLFKATVISNVTGGGNTSGWKLEGVIKRGANAASTTIVGTVTTTLLAQDAGALTWAIAATADTTNGGLRITFTGQAATTIRTVAKLETTEVTF